MALTNLLTNLNNSLSNCHLPYVDQLATGNNNVTNKIINSMPVVNNNKVQITDEMTPTLVRSILSPLSSPTANNTQIVGVNQSVDVCL